jgi:antitoxin PrlF
MQQDLFSKVTVKYQASIPKTIRNILGIKSGDLVGFKEEGGKVSIYKVDSKTDKDYLKLVSSNFKEWNSKNDEEQFEYLSNFIKK